MKKQYVYTLPAADAANIYAVEEDLYLMIDEEQINRMGRCIIEAIVESRLHVNGAIPGNTLDFCEKTLEECTLIEAKQIVLNVGTQKKGDAQ